MSKQEEPGVTIGRRIRLIREQLNISQGQLANLLGIYQTTVSKYETGLTDLPISKLVRISEVLRIKTSQLVRGLGGKL